jgi:hypothetical protein
MLGKKCSKNLFRKDQKTQIGNDSAFIQVRSLKFLAEFKGLGAKDKQRCTALHHASTNGRLGAASVLLQAYHSFIDNFQFLSLHCSSFSSSHESS